MQYFDNMQSLNLPGWSEENKEMRQFEFSRLTLVSVCCSAAARQYTEEVNCVIFETSVVTMCHLLQHYDTLHYDHSCVCADPGGSAVCCRLIAGIAVSNPAGDMYVRLLCLLCVVQAATFATSWSVVRRGPIRCVWLCVICKPQQWGRLGPIWTAAVQKICMYVFHVILTTRNKHLNNIKPLICVVGRDGSVGIATRYGLDGQGNESRWGRDFPHPSRTALGPTQPPI